MLIGMDRFTVIVHNLRTRQEISVDASRQPDWSEMDRRIHCPQCGHEMDTHAYGGGGNVIIEDCENCSLNWLDANELERIAQAPDREYASDV